MFYCKFYFTCHRSFNDIRDRDRPRDISCSCSSSSCHLDMEEVFRDCSAGLVVWLGGVVVRTSDL